jgi:Repeat of unknown function (DUF5650)
MTIMRKVLSIAMLGVTFSVGSVAAGDSRAHGVLTAVDVTLPAGMSSQWNAPASAVTVLPNGNVVIVDPMFSAPGGPAEVGAVFLYDGATHALISALTGSTAGDRVGFDGLTLLSNGNFVVFSQSWRNGGGVPAGAVTWFSATAGVSGVVGPSNSLVGASGDWIGIQGVTALKNGNYVVASPFWRGGIGAATWADGAIGVRGTVTSSNSLVGSTVDDRVGGPIVELSDGNYVVTSPFWDNGAVQDVGAVTWASGTTGGFGPVTASNSLIGSTANDRVASGGVTPLTNGNYVVSSHNWYDQSTGRQSAATWVRGGRATAGVVSGSNSLIAFSEADDNLLPFGVTALTNGNFVVAIPLWDNGAAKDAGAVVFGNGSSGLAGMVSPANALVGSTSRDGVGNGWNDLGGHHDRYGVTALTNGHYVVSSPFWHNASGAFVGAVTWGSGTSGARGFVDASNSLVGSTAADNLGESGVIALPNGNYVVGSPGWDNGPTVDVGAVTWGSGTVGVRGAVSTANSLVGSSKDDAVSWFRGITVLANGNYVVASGSWDNGAATNAGAVTWANGSTGLVGVVSASNSLVGSTADDMMTNVTALTNGNYVVASTQWDNGSTRDVGAVTWGSGTTGRAGSVSSSNSLVGSTANDWVGFRVTAMTNGNYIVSSPNWDSGSAPPERVSDYANGRAGAATWADGTTGISGAVSASNSLVGSVDGDAIGSRVTALPDGTFVNYSSGWDNRGVSDVGAVTWADSPANRTGVVSTLNSTVGLTEHRPIADNSGYLVHWGGDSIRWAFDGVHNRVVIVRAEDRLLTWVGSRSAPPADPPPVDPPKGSPATNRFVPVAPTRVFDTRAGSPVNFTGSRPKAGTTIDVQVSGLGGVPATGVTSVVLNVTAIEANDAGFVTVFASGGARPNTSSLNINTRGSTVANQVTVALGADGKVSLFTDAGTDFAVDVAGYYAPAEASNHGRLKMIKPTRSLDSRSGAKPRAGATVDVKITGAGEIPLTGVSAAIVNFTATQTADAGFFTLYPKGESIPNVSNLNVNGANQTIANAAIVPVGADGSISIYTQNGAHLLLDVVGYYTDATADSSAAGLFVAQPAARKLDTRNASKPAAGSTATVNLGVPAAAASAVINLTLTDTTAAGYGTAFKSGIARPDTSIVNADGPDLSVANAAIVQLAAGEIDVFNDVATHVLVDVSGYFT